MPYPNPNSLKKIMEMISLYSHLKHERGSTGISPLLKKTERMMKTVLRNLQQLPENPARAAREPDSLDAIKRLRPDGPRRIWDSLPARKTLSA